MTALRMKIERRSWLRRVAERYFKIMGCNSKEAGILFLILAVIATIGMLSGW